jgi:hypothetical protein
MKKEMLIIVVSFLILLPCMGLAGLLPDTGQTKCYDNTQEITCPQPGEPFYGQDAQYPCNPHSYTKLDACGNSLDAGAPFWAMVHDNITGLIWEAKTDDWSIHDRDNSYTWYDAQDFFITALNFAHFGGYSDWRLPTVKELSFLVDRDWHDPAIIEVNYFYNTMLSAYWSSTTYAGNPDFEAWYVNFGYGNVDYDVKSSDIWCNYVRAVRGGQTSNSFIDNGDGTVTDTSTGLMWEQNGSTIGTWQDAFSYCETLSFAGHNDWRLPDINELQSCVDYNRF